MEMLLALVTVLAADSIAPANLVQNGNFEVPREDVSSVPAGWGPARTPGSEKQCRMELVDAEAADHGRCVSIAIDKDHPDAQTNYNWTAAVNGCEAGKTYRLTGYVKTSGVKTSPVICVQCWNLESKKMVRFATTQHSARLVGDNGWTQVTTEFQVPADADEIRIRAALVAAGNQGATAWFDDISVSEVSPTSGDRAADARKETAVRR